MGQRRQVVIPREMLETLNIQEGDFVAFAEQKNGVLIKPRRVVDPDDVHCPARFRSPSTCRRVSQWPDLTPIRLRSLHARDAGGPFRRPTRVVRRRDRPRADGGMRAE